MDSRQSRPWAIIGISKSWYYSIKGGSKRPTLELSLRIYDRTGEQYGVTAGLTAEEIEVLRKALNNSSSPIDISRRNQLQNDDGELRADSPRDRERVSAAKDQQEREGS